VGGIGQRELAWDGCHNVRDLGGLPLAAGGETRYRTVVRADSLTQLTSTGWSDALSYGVQRVVDLRFAEERSCDDGTAVPVEVVHVSLFGARDLAHLMAHLGQVMRDDTFKSHVEELAQLWNGQTSFSSHTVNYTLTGERLFKGETESETLAKILRIANVRTASH